MNEPPVSGPYTLDGEPVARGGQGEVWFGTDGVGREVAIKVAAHGEQARRALEREIELMGALRAAGVVGVMPVLDVTEQDGRVAMVMPRLPTHMGEWLRRIVTEPDASSLEDVFQRAEQLAQLVASVHDAPTSGGTVVHRDIKPENLYLDDKGGMFLADFGGALAVEELRVVELAMFGTPMWAPLDQLLPGRSIPDPTWDTYAICVLFYAAITGARPAYQSDPREILTERGRALWAAARAAVDAPPAERLSAHQQFSQQRKGAGVADVIDLTGRATLVSSDRRALHEGLERLATLAGIPQPKLPRVERALWTLLARGLSPLAHPSPPNRYRDAGELAAAIADVRDLFPAEQAPSSPRRADVPAPARPPPPVPSPWLLPGALAVGTLALVLLATWIAWPTDTGSTVRIDAATLELEAGTVAVAAHHTSETTVGAELYAACVAQGVCTAAHSEGVAASVDVEQARHFCSLQGGTLPSRAQWQAAAGFVTRSSLTSEWVRGFDGRTRPIRGDGQVTVGDRAPFRCVYKETP